MVRIAAKHYDISSFLRDKEQRVAELHEYPGYDPDDVHQRSAAVLVVEGEQFNIYILYTDAHYAFDLVWNKKTPEEYIGCKYRGIPRVHAP
jgi:hypothetical protein